MSIEDKLGLFHHLPHTQGLVTGASRHRSLTLKTVHGGDAILVPKPITGEGKKKINKKIILAIQLNYIPNKFPSLLSALYHQTIKSELSNTITPTLTLHYPYHTHSHTPLSILHPFSHSIIHITPTLTLYPSILLHPLSLHSPNHTHCPSYDKHTPTSLPPSQSFHVSHLVQVPYFHCTIRRAAEELMGASLKHQTLQEK